MSPNYAIAVRFITSRKRSMLMSLAGIVFGIGFFIVTQAQTSGFERFYIQTIIGTDSPMRIARRYDSTPASSVTLQSAPNFQIPIASVTSTIEGVRHPGLVMDAVMAFEGVTAVAEVVRDEATVRHEERTSTATVNGIRLSDQLAVTNLEDQVIDGSLTEFQLDNKGVMLGYLLADEMNVGVGDYLIIETPIDSRRYTIKALFESGIELIDRNRIFMHLPEARSILGKPFVADHIQIALADPQEAERIAQQIRESLGYKAISWQEREKTWLEVFNALRISSAITVSTIILISGLGMFNTLAMLVMEKTRDIAILRSMGYTQGDIVKIFLWQGAIVYFFGTLLGWLFGAGVTWGISNLPIQIKGIFKTDSFIVNWDLNHYIWATVIAAIVVAVASYLPARRAAALQPGNIIRGMSQ